MMVEPLLCPRKFRDMMYMSLHKFAQISSVCVLPNIIMPLIGTCSRSGLVIHVNGNESTVAGCLHGYLLKQTIICKIALSRC